MFEVITLNEVECVTLSPGMSAIVYEGDEIFIESDGLEACCLEYNAETIEFIENISEYTSLGVMEILSRYRKY